MKTSKAVLYLLAAFTCTVSVAAPPAKPPPAPPNVDIAYLSISSSNTSSWPPIAIRGIDVSDAGASSADVELWRSTNRHPSAIAWDPDGRYLAWAEGIDNRGTRALMVATPGQVPRVAYVFSNTGIYKSNLADGLAWGRGCGSTPVLYFWGVQYSTNWSTVWVIDPFAALVQPYQVAAPPGPPIGERGGTLHGLAVSPLGRTLVFGAYSYELGDRAAVALPLTCSSADALPEPAGPAQPLFAARYGQEQAWFQGFDWSSDGRRIAVAMGRWVPTSAGSALQYDPELWIADLNYVASDGAEQVTVASLTHSAAGVTTFPSWAPVTSGATCNRLAFMRSGVVWLHDVPRDGFSGADCAIGTPTMIGGKAVVALDWR
jgi:hypothetical protein